jgi:diguanylate cyclase (GGDEF)-like protein
MLEIEKRDAIHARVLQAVNNSISDDDLRHAIEQLAIIEGDEVYSALLRVLASVEFDAALAKQLWERAIEHDESLAKSLGRPVGMLVALHDFLTNIEHHISKLKIIAIDVYSKIAKSAITDGLTGLFNSTYFKAELEREIDKCARYGSFVSLIMFDIDDFKKFNDTFGHPSGDRALKEFSSLMREKARQVDLLARYGGEEFVCILPNTNSIGALALAERIRESIIMRGIPVNGMLLRVAHITCSGGIATFGGDIVLSGEQLLDKADQALYRAKKEGKNRICVDFFERREFVRIGFPLLLNYRKMDKKSEEKNVVMINFSVGGILFRSSEKFELTSLIELEIPIPDVPHHKMKVPSRVIRTKELPDGQVEVAVRFLEVEQQDRNKIYRMLFERKKHG